MSLIYYINFYLSVINYKKDGNSRGAVELACGRYVDALLLALYSATSFEE